MKEPEKKKKKMMIMKMKKKKKRKRRKEMNNIWKDNFYKLSIDTQRICWFC